jgi:hypothetical protein
MTSTTPTPSVVEPPVVPLAADEAGAPVVGNAEPRAVEEPARRRWWRKESPNPWRAWVLARLHGPRCPLCREEADTLRRYYFWFLEEQYAEPRVAHRLQQARGFCRRHSAHLLQQGMPFRISVVAGYVLAACADWLRAVSGARSPAPGRTASPGRASRGQFAAEMECPACVDERDARERYAIALTGCLEDAEVREAFRASWGLCLPHFLGVAPRVGWQALQFLVAEQIGRLEGARDRLASDSPAPTNGEGRDPRREAILHLVGADIDERIRTLHVAGRPPDGTPIRGDEVGARVPKDDAGSWSPAFREACELLLQPGCGICRVGARAGEEYLAWLEAEITDYPSIGWPPAWKIRKDVGPSSSRMEPACDTGRSCSSGRRVHPSGPTLPPSSWPGSRWTAGRWRSTCASNPGTGGTRRRGPRTRPGCGRVPA